MKKSIFEKKKTPPATWAELEQKVHKDADLAPAWVKKVLSRAERRAVLVIEDEVYRPYCRIVHHKHEFPYLLDHDTAHAIEKNWNRYSRKIYDRVVVETVVYSLLNNKADRR